jgi:pyridoxal phosphate enzyme (YggS family)
VSGVDSRREELAWRLAAVRERIAAASRAAGRDPAEVTLVTVTKTYPAADVLRLAALGATEIAENRDQEAAPKAAEVAAAGVDVRWHFVGQVQRNKARSIVRYADVVHSVDGVRLARALARAAGEERERPLDVLVQVSLDGDPGRGGAVDGGSDPDRELWAVVAALAAAPDALRLAGMMAVAPLDWVPAKAYERLAGLAERLRAEHPAAAPVSAGMTDDLEDAVMAGATHVRIGSAILGKRLPPAVT